MQDNDFEKQVHQKMGELKLLPSEAVWEQVERRLHGRKRRSWVIWFPLLLSGLSIAGYVALNTGESLNLDRVQTAGNKSLSKPTDKNVYRITDSKTAIPGNNQMAAYGSKKIEELSLKKKSENLLVETRIARQRNKEVRKQKPYIQDALVTGVTSSSGNNIIFLRKKPSGKVTDHTSVTPLGFLTEGGSSVKEDIDPDMVQDAGRQFSQAEIKTVPLSVRETNTSLTLIDKNPFPEIVIKPYRQNRRWKWGLSFQAGRSSLTNGTLDGMFNSGSALNFSNNINQFLANPNPASNGVYKEPYPASASAGFSAGAFITKDLSRRFAISLGMNYTLLSTSITVGKKIGSLFLVQPGVVGTQQSLNQSFRLSDAGSYTNKYHYIDIPVVVRSNLTRNWKAPLHWDIGLSLSTLIASNALNFDRNKAIYYIDNQLLNKTQFNVITGLSLKLPAGKKFSLQAGPQFQYGLSHVLANETNNSNHFLCIGLKANLLFRQKIK